MPFCAANLLWVVCPTRLNLQMADSKQALPPRVSHHCLDPVNSSRLALRDDELMSGEMTGGTPEPLRGLCPTTRLVRFRSMEQIARKTRPYIHDEKPRTSRHR